MNTPQTQRIEILAYQIWEEQGRPDGMDKEHWLQAEHRLSSESADSGLASDGPTTNGSREQAQDTPGRSKTASSRQQTQPAQVTQTGSSELDKKAQKTARG